jgi:carbon storage regulator
LEEGNPMLILSRKVGEKIAVGDEITIFVNRIAGNRVTLGIQAPDHVRVVRGELKRFVKEFGSDDPEPSAAATPVPTTVTLDPSTPAGFAPRSAR